MEHIIPSALNAITVTAALLAFFGFFYVLVEYTPLRVSIPSMIFVIVFTVSLFVRLFG